MYSKIKSIIDNKLKQIEYTSVILFGSRARDDFNKMSDYDILIVMKKNTNIIDKISLSTLLRKELAHNGIDADIIIKSADEVEYYKDKVGSVVKSAIEEGIPL